MKQDTLESVSCLAVHDDKNITVHGTCNDEESVVQFVRVINSSTDEGVDYKVLKRAKVPGQIYDMSWMGDKLVTIVYRIIQFLQDYGEHRWTSFLVQE